MLVSPSRIDQYLRDILVAELNPYIHTALLIKPQGQLISSASTFSYDAAGSTDHESDGVEEEGQWLAGPERLRLLLGLASQWEEDESSRVQCEVGRPGKTVTDG